MVSVLQVIVDFEVLVFLCFDLQVCCGIVQQVLAKWVVPTFFLNDLIPERLNNSQDKLLWRHLDDHMKSFSVSNVWHTRLPRAPKVDWLDVVWFPQYIPIHAFIL